MLCLCKTDEESAGTRSEERDLGLGETLQKEMSVEEERKPFFYGSSLPPLPTSSSSASLSAFSIVPPQQSRRPSSSRYFSWRPTRRDALFLLSGTLLGCIFFKLAFASSTSQHQQQQHHQIAAKRKLDFLVVGDWGRKGLYNQSQVAIQVLIALLKRKRLFVITED
ncbi:hypothetical protein L7F22_055308 [Adiantum nelumboides]|nr:hypothetical protein [Adiantum nelumboides]